MSAFAGWGSPVSSGERNDLRALLDVQNVILREMREDIREIRTDAAETKQLAKETNGRVRKLELWRATVEGAKAAMGWVTPLALGTTAAAAGAVLTKLLSS
jgi:hypothetical protein